MLKLTIIPLARVSPDCPQSALAVVIAATVLSQQRSSELMHRNSGWPKIGACGRWRFESTRLSRTSLDFF